MPEFLRLIPPQVALQRWFGALPQDLRTPAEVIPTAEGLGRVLAEDVTAPHPLPPFTRSTVDGFAVRAADTHGASASLPAYLRVVGEVPMGVRSEIVLEPAQAALVHTGGMIPEGADAVVMIEDTQAPEEEEIEVLKPVADGENVLRVGEDVGEEELVLQAGMRIRPQEVGGLMALGVTEIRVAARPRVGILSTGDEVIPPQQEPKPGQVRDVNTYTLSSLVRRSGGEPVPYGVIPDSYEALSQNVRMAHAENDVVVVTAGSSVSARDITVDVVAKLGAPGVLVHGVSVRPGKPTILAVADGVPVIGLPGNPVSALVIAELFLTPLLQQLLGLKGSDPTPTLTARLQINVASETGREDYLPVRLHQTDEGLEAEPVFGRSNLIFTLVRAHGLVKIPPEATGLAAGETVEVRLI
jgi:molybdopterin molybdotransferase